MGDKVIITNFTDPVCTWCWGTEPIFRKLETHYPNQIEFHYVMGGLVEDINQFQDFSNGIDAGSEGANQQIVAHWLESAERHGMPIESQGFALFSNEYPSTYPQNIAYKAAQKAAPEKADGFLRRIREATLTEAQITSRQDVLVSLADEVGINVADFIKYLKDGTAKQAFYEDLSLTRSMGVRGFPTFLIKYHDQSVMLRGYQDFEAFVGVIDTVTGGIIKPVKPERNDHTLLSFLTVHHKSAAEEIRQAFDLSSIIEVDNWIMKLENQRKVRRIKAGQSYFVEATKQRQGLYCNLTTGICSDL